MILTKRDCYELAKLVSYDYTNSNKYYVQEFPQFMAISVNSQEIMTISKDSLNVRFKVDLSKFQKQLVYKTMGYITWLQRYNG